MAIAPQFPVPLRSIELFTGAGGLAMATHLTGFHHESLFEWNTNACETLRTNSASEDLSLWRDRVVEGDVRSAAFRQFDGIDLVAGGPPCQPFSLGGLHKGMDDQRDMIPQFIRAVREARPRVFIMENVRGLTRKAFEVYLNWSILQLTYPEIERRPGEAWQDHLARLRQHHDSPPGLQGLVYRVVHRVLNAADFGVPQCRERLFVVGFRCDLDVHWTFPEPTHSQERLLHDQWVSKSYWERLGATACTVPPGVKLRLHALEKLDVSTLLPWKTIREAISDLPEPFTLEDHRGEIFNHRLQLGARPYPGHTGSPYDAPSKTLKAGAHGVPGGENMIDFGPGAKSRYRYFTIREAARIQTFPDTWHFRGAWGEAMRQLGNAVPVDLAKVVAGSVSSQLSTEGTS